MKKSNIQSQKWGTIEWIYQGNPRIGKGSLSIGIVTTWPGMCLNEHIHYGEEQVLYVLEGQIRHVVNGTAMIYGPGGILHLPVDVRHSSANVGKGPSRELLISNPALYQPGAPAAIQEAYQEMPESYDLCTAVEAIRSTVLEPLNIPLSIWNNQNQIIWDNRLFPSYCAEHCPNAPACRRNPLVCSPAKPPIPYLKYTCPHGMTLIEIPILFLNQQIGCLRGGHIWENTRGTPIPESEYGSSYGAVSGLVCFLKQIADNIATFCNFDLLRQKIRFQKSNIEKETYSNLCLSASLKRVEQQVTDLQINHHFLFNILTSLGEMALRAGSMELYRSIVSLSQILRYPVQNRGGAVQLSQEMEYVQNYLNLQKTRWKNLEFSCSLEEANPNCLVPFNFLQPVVENAFVHGFQNMGENTPKRLSLTAVEKNGRIRITVSNSGSIIEMPELLRINEAMKADTGHGMSLIYEKCSQLYGTDFSIRLDSVPPRNTLVEIDLPILPMANGE